MTELVRKQIIFCRYVAILFDEFPDFCFQIGEAWRSPETCELYAKQGKGIVNSCHTLRLAIDLNLWVNEKLSDRREDYQTVGHYWKELPQLYPDAIAVETCWGGDFKSLCDIYHFSIEHNGVR